MIIWFVNINVILPHLMVMVEAMEQALPQNIRLSWEHFLQAVEWVISLMVGSQKKMVAHKFLAQQPCLRTT